MLKKSKRSWRYFCKFWFGFTPHAKQLEMADERLRLVAMGCGSGAGKTFGTSAFLAWCAWKNDGHDYADLAPTNRQAELSIDDIKQHVINGQGRFNIWIERWPTKDQPFLQLINGSRVWFLNTAYGADHIKGLEFHGAVHDEAAIDKESTFRIIRTRVRKEPGWLRVLSTPKGRNWFFQFSMEVQNEQRWAEGKGLFPDRRFIHASSWDNPHYSRTILEDRKRSEPDRVYRQEYMGEFVETEGATFRYEDLERIFDPTWEPETAPRPGGLYVNAWDLGRKTSWTVQTTLAFDKLEDVPGELRGVEQREFHGERWPKIFSEIDERGRYWEALPPWPEDGPDLRPLPQSWSTLDSTGVGDVVMQAVDLPTSGFLFTAKSRGEMLLRLQRAAEQPGRLRLPADWRRLRTQMQLHTAKEDAEGQTWDHLDSLGIAVHQAEVLTFTSTPFAALG